MLHPKLEDLEEGTERDVTNDIAKTKFSKDCKIIAGNGDIIRCFKIFLCARSDVFSAMLTNDNFKESRDSEVKIAEFGPRRLEGILELSSEGRD